MNTHFLFGMFLCLNFLTMYAVKQELFAMPLLHFFINLFLESYKRSKK